MQKQLTAQKRKRLSKSDQEFLSEYEEMEGFLKEFSEKAFDQFDLTIQMLQVHTEALKDIGMTLNKISKSQIGFQKTA